MEQSTESYGICALSVVPVRMEPSDKAEIGTQLLFGDALTIIRKTEDGKWAYIQNLYDEYFGWIDSKQYKPVSQEYFETYKNFKSPLSNGLLGLIKSDTRFFPIMMGSVLPMYEKGLVRIDDEFFTYEGEYVYPELGGAIAIERIARFYLSAPYLWGGKCHFGIDCSGFVQQVYRLNGYKLPRDSFKQAEEGIIVPYGKHKPGDLAFFQNVNGKVVHVGIVLPYQQIIHASGEVRVDNMDEVGIFNLARGQYSHKLHSIKRVLEQGVF